jgi:DNA (cytosine-5)-methyltransferase 1
VNAWYNDNDAFCCDWMAELQKAHLISEGPIDGRGIEEIRGDEIAGTWAHFFAGIGGWDYALRLAGWPEDREVWTGSCPCQPFSCAGKRKGTDDKRHLWPEFFRIIGKQRPATIFGEQVASKDGRTWFAGVRSDLEGLGYAVGSADLCAAGIGAPHVRQRLFWVAYASSAECKWRNESKGKRRRILHLANSRENMRMAYPECKRTRAGEPGEQGSEGSGRNRPAIGCEVVGLADAESGGQRTDGSTPRQSGYVEQRGKGFRLGDPIGAGLEGREGEPRDHGGECQAVERTGDDVRGPWDYCQWIQCGDGKARRIPDAESGILPLATGVPNRVGLLRGAGNSIVPPLAAEFVKAFMETGL